MTVVSPGALRFEDLPGRRSADPFAGAPGGSSVRVVEMERTPGRVAHRHPHSEEVVFVDSGRGQLWLEGERIAVEAGDLVRIPKGAAHATVPEEGGAMRLVCFFPHPALAENAEDTNIIVS